MRGTPSEGEEHDDTNTDQTNIQSIGFVENARIGDDLVSGISLFRSPSSDTFQITVNLMAPDGKPVLLFFSHQNGQCHKEKRFSSPGQPGSTETLSPMSFEFELTTLMNVVAENDKQKIQNLTVKRPPLLT